MLKWWQDMCLLLHNDDAVESHAVKAAMYDSFSFLVYEKIRNVHHFEIVYGVFRMC